MLYASLIGPLFGLYYPIPTDDMDAARTMMHTSKLAKLWCSIYTYEEVLGFISKFGGHVLPTEFADRLDYDSHAVEIMKNVPMKMEPILDPHPEDWKDPERDTH